LTDNKVDVSMKSSFVCPFWGKLPIGRWAMKVRYIVYENKNWKMLERTFENTQTLPRIGEEICFCVSGYEESFGRVKSVVHFPQATETREFENEPVAVVIAEMCVEDIEHFLANDKNNWTVYDGDLYDPRTAG